MKNHIKEIIILIIQLLFFYLLPLFAYSHGTMGVVVMILLAATFVLSIILGMITKEKIKYLYPFVISGLFIPSVFMYYNESALIHSLWYLAVSLLGVTFGKMFYKNQTSTE